MNVARHLPSPDDCALRLEDLVAGYGDAEVLHGMTIGVRPGEIMAVLGRNGAGKSTLCNVAAGAVALTSGHVMLAGDDVSAQPAFVRTRRGLTLGPQARGVFPGLTVEENLRWCSRDRELRDRGRRGSPRCVTVEVRSRACCPAASSRCFAGARPRGTTEGAHRRRTDARAGAARGRGRARRRAILVPPVPPSSSPRRRRAR